MYPNSRKWSRYANVEDQFCFTNNTDIEQNMDILVETLAPLAHKISISLKKSAYH